MGTSGGMGAGGGAPGGGGQPGKKRPTGAPVDTGGDMGFGSSGGGFAGSSSGSGGSGFGAAGSKGNDRWSSTKPGSGAKDSEAMLNLAGEAPIPGEPGLYEEGDTFHVARVSFTVKLVDESSKAPDA
jgi:hypothetical protein